MMQTVEFFYDYGSPNSYLAWARLPEICSENGAGLSFKPILLGGIFKAVGNETPVNIKAKGAWMFDDIARYADYYGIPFRMNPHFIFNTLGAMRGAIWAGFEGCIDQYNQAMFQAAWVEGRNVADESEMRSIVAGAGLDAVAFAVAVQQSDIKKALIDETNKAVARGVFGAPTMFIAGAMHFGQDRLPWIERALSGK